MHSHTQSVMRRASGTCHVCQIRYISAEVMCYVVLRHVQQREALVHYDVGHRDDTADAACVGARAVSGGTPVEAY